MIALVLVLAAVSPLTGSWEGTSLCQVRPSPCHDEHVVYRIAALGDGYRIAAYKLVAGKRDYMGDLDLAWAGRRLVGSTRDRSGQASRWTFTVAGDHLSGRLVTPDGRLYRKIEVDRRRAPGPRPGS
jgi:hypothetical protein